MCAEGADIKAGFGCCAEQEQMIIISSQWELYSMVGLCLNKLRWNDSVWYCSTCKLLIGDMSQDLPLWWRFGLGLVLSVCHVKFLWCWWIWYFLHCSRVAGLIGVQLISLKLKCDRGWICIFPERALYTITGWFVTELKNCLPAFPVFLIPVIRFQPSGLLIQQKADYLVPLFPVL